MRLAHRPMLSDKLRIRRCVVAFALFTTLGSPCSSLAQTSPIHSGSYRVTNPTFLVTTFGAKCDGVSDDTNAFQAALDAAGARCQAAGAYVISGFAMVIVPDGARCRINRGLINAKSDCVGIASYAGATLDFSGLSNGATALTLKHLSYGGYSGNVPRFENIQMIGPGRARSTVGIASETPSTTYRQLNIHGFGHGYEVHSGSWLNHFANSSISDCAVDLYCGRGLKDAGEQISFESGTLFNSDTAIENDSCEFNVTDSSLDEFNGPAVVNGGGSTRLTSDHIEYVNRTTNAPLVVTNGACNDALLHFFISPPPKPSASPSLPRHQRKRRRRDGQCAQHRTPQSAWPRSVLICFYIFGRTRRASLPSPTSFPNPKSSVLEPPARDACHMQK